MLCFGLSGWNVKKILAASRHEQRILSRKAGKLFPFWTVFVQEKGSCLFRFITYFRVISINFLSSQAYCTFLLPIFVFNTMNLITFMICVLCEIHADHLLCPISIIFLQERTPLHFLHALTTFLHESYLIIGGCQV